MKPFRLITIALPLSLIILFGSSQKILAQQKDGDEANSSSNSNATSGRVNFNILTLLNGEYLEAFGANNSRGILRGHPTIPGLELGTTTADPLIFSTNSVERMRILSNGFVGIGTSTPGVALDVAQNRAIRVGQATLSSGGDYANLANHGWFNGTWQGDGLPGATYSINGAQHTWYTHNASGVFTALMQLTAAGSLGIGTQSPSSRLHVDGGSIRLAGTAGETPFQIYSYANSHSLWFTSANPGTSEIQLSPGYAVDFDRSLAVQYTPGTTGARTGILKIGQLAKNNANWTHGETALFTSGTERLRVNLIGNVGIGTGSPAYKLDVAGPIRSSSGGIVFPDGTVQTTAGGTSSQWTTSGANIYYNVGGGNVGIGGTNPAARFQVFGVSPGSAGTAVFSGTQVSSHFNYNGDNTEDTYVRGGKSTSRVILNDANSGAVLALGTGNFGIGTASPTEKLEVVGNIKVSGTINAKYQDVAEWVESSQAPSAGTVVILDSSKANNVIASTGAYDTRVAGVISLQPGLTLGEAGEGRVLVATTGRVKVKVDATKGPIEIGDLLVTSDREGFAMKSLPVEIGGARLHRPGTLIGKALEPLRSGTGEILVLLSLQ